MLYRFNLALLQPSTTIRNECINSNIVVVCCAPQHECGDNISALLQPFCHLYIRLGFSHLSGRFKVVMKHFNIAVLLL